MAEEKPLLPETDRQRLIAEVVASVERSSATLEDDSTPIERNWNMEHTSQWLAMSDAQSKREYAEFQRGQYLTFATIGLVLGLILILVLTGHERVVSEGILKVLLPVVSVGFGAYQYGKAKRKPD